MSIKFEPLGDHDRNGFSCEENQLNKYIKEIARQDQKKNSAQVYVAVDKDSPKKIIGFYTLCPASIPKADLPIENQKKLPKYPHISGYLIGRLARDQNYKSQGIGDLLMVNALKKVIAASEIASGNLVFVEAKNEKAREFYKKFGFESLQNNKDFLFLPISTIKNNPRCKDKKELPSFISIVLEGCKKLFTCYISHFLTAIFHVSYNSPFLAFPNFGDSL